MMDQLRGMLEVRLPVIMVTLSLALIPSPASASCSAPAASLAWPRNGMEEVPLDAALVLYGRDIDNPSGGWELLLESETGEPVPFTATSTLMADDYFLIVAVPDGTFAPDTGYTGVFTQTEGESMPREFTFRTGDGLGQPPSLAPEMNYQGVGVPMQDEDGSSCMDADMEEAGVLAMAISGEDLGDRLIVIEVRDSQEVKVFDRLLSGASALDRQLATGHGICSAGFPVDPCEHYCVRAAALDHLGTPGPWSDWSCSKDIGWYQVCEETDVPVFFGEDIPGGMTPTDEVLACAPGLAAALDSETGPEDSGCQATGSPAAGSWWLLGLIGALGLLGRLRGRKVVLTSGGSVVTSMLVVIAIGTGGFACSTQDDPAGQAGGDSVVADEGVFIEEAASEGLPPFTCPYPKATREEALLTCEDELTEAEIADLYPQLMEEHGKKAMVCDPWMFCVFASFNGWDPNDWLPPDAQFDKLYNEMDLTETQIAAHECLLYGTRGVAEVNWNWASAHHVGGRTPASLKMPMGYDVNTWAELWDTLQEDLGPTIWTLLGRTADDVLDAEVTNSAGGKFDIRVGRVHRGYPVPENYIRFIVDELFIDPEDTFCERDWPGYPPV
ncbi:MAG: hypothetical protein ABIK09_20325, partial [Pseudomonadota bacterium]